MLAEGVRRARDAADTLAGRRRSPLASWATVALVVVSISAGAVTLRTGRRPIPMDCMPQPVRGGSHRGARPPAVLASNDGDQPDYVGRLVLAGADRGPVRRSDIFASPDLGSICGVIQQPSSAGSRPGQQ